MNWVNVTHRSAQRQVVPHSCREEDEEEDASMTPDASPVDYEELGNMDSWTNDVRALSEGSISLFQHIG